MFFPLSTDRRLKRTPWVNYALIAANIVVYAFTWHQVQAFHQLRGAGLDINSLFERAPAIGYWLWPSEGGGLRLHQFITYQFLHSGPEPMPFLGLRLPLHLIFNMLFLFVFGNAVEDRIGKLGYLFFYLAGGVFAGLAHVLTDSNPVLGASGAVAGVTGAYLALFPLSNVTIAYWFIVIFGTFEVSSIVLILFRVAQDMVFQLSNYGNTAYGAHLAGYLYGFVIGMGMLLGRLLPREPYDMLSLIEQKRRNRQFKKLSRGGMQPWDHAPGKPGAPLPAGHANPFSADDTALMQHRAAISQALERHELSRAATLYTNLLEEHPDQALAQQAQLDVANQLMADGRYDTAARAYELFLQTYRGYGQADDIRLILGLIYARYLRQAGRARELLTAVRERLDAEKRQLADSALEELG